MATTEATVVVTTTTMNGTSSSASAVEIVAAAAAKTKTKKGKKKKCKFGTKCNRNNCKLMHPLPKIITNSGIGGGDNDNDNDNWGCSNSQTNSSKPQEQQIRTQKHRNTDNTLVIKNFNDKNVKEDDIRIMFAPYADQTKSKVVYVNVNHHRGLAFIAYDCDTPIHAVLKKHSEIPFQWNGNILEVDQKTLEQRARRNKRKAELSSSKDNNNNNNNNINNTATTTTTTTTITTTTNNTRSNKSGSSGSGSSSSRAQEAQAALEVARLKLRVAKERASLRRKTDNADNDNDVAMTNSNRNTKKRRLQHQYQYQHARASSSPSPLLMLPPVSALSSSSLIISNISQTGCEDIVYHDMIERDFSRAQLQLVEALGGKEFIDALHSTSTSIANTNSGPDEKNDDDSSLIVSSTTTATTTTTTSLAHRRIQLQKELMALKEKLEKNQQKVAAASSNNNNNNDNNGNNSNQEQQIQVPIPIPIPIILTKQELERRKVEAKNDMDISYWKHFVSKQEHMLQNVTKQVLDNESSLEQCLKERHSTNIQLNSIQSNINTYGAKQDVIEDGIIKTTMQLLNVRQQFYDATSTRTRTSQNTTTNSTTTTRKDNDKKESRK